MVSWGRITHMTEGNLGFDIGQNGLGLPIHRVNDYCGRTTYTTCYLF